ncbi:FecR family protein [Psychroserpens luteolus]|uniref:FecR family protein n=1 Tax=Psychroserpens luteolus TaxID=2855840 RepID=UPI001E299C8A|nr:FecR family protein [Psychroserpens luteolus]MCD2258347.1 FecR family protein [Psychroserpens luteolus]
MEQLYDDTFLAKWLDGTLSKEELRKFEADPDYKKYLDIVETTNLAEFPEFDIDANFKATWEKIELENTKNLVSKPKFKISNWIYAIAASLFLFLGYSLFFKTTTYRSQLAQQIEFSLPDNSKVYLNADSNIKYKPYNWNKKRGLTLEGEAYFEVEKGSTFTVNTVNGDVRVLGTRFTVNSRDNFYNVVCYEGKVKVMVEGYESIVLTKGQGFSIQNSIEQNNYINNDNSPRWLQHESSFNTVNILEVIEELERQYSIEVEGKEHLKPINFTGRFAHGDLNVALRTIFETLDIPYILKIDGNVIIKKY